MSPRRQLAQIRRRQVRDGRYGRIWISAGLEIDFDQTDAGQRARFYVVDAAAKREETLKASRYIRLNLFRRHA